MRDCSTGVDADTSGDYLSNEFLNMSAIESSTFADRPMPEDEDFGFSEPPVYPPSGGLKVNNKGAERRKITPPPWSMVVHIPAAKETLSNHENSLNLSPNPFKRELFKSLIDGKSNFMRAKKKARNVAEKSSSSLAARRDSQPICNKIATEADNLSNERRAKPVPSGILKRKEKRMVKSNMVTPSTIQEETQAIKECHLIGKKSSRIKKDQRFLGTKDETKNSKSLEHPRYIPMPSFLRNSFPSIYGVCKNLDINNSQSNLDLDLNSNLYSKIKFKPIENRPASLASLLNERFEDHDIIGENGLYSRYLDRERKPLCEGHTWTNYPGADCSHNMDENNGEWYVRSNGSKPNRLSHSQELGSGCTRQDDHGNDGVWMDYTQENTSVMGDWEKYSNERDLSHQTSAPKSVYFDLENRNEDMALFSDSEDVQFNAERLLSICDSGIGVDDDFRSMSRSSLQILSDDEYEEINAKIIPETLTRPSLGSVPDDSDKWQNLEVLCGNRVSQMTQTYHDIEAVTRLLQEKEKDLELAARIGQQLLGRNKALEEKNSNLESDICVYTEKITQLRHDLQMKTDLLHVYTDDYDESSADTTPTGGRHINVDFLQARVKNLETENVSLRQEASQLACDTFDCENKENELVHDVIKQLNEANLHVHQLSEELSKKIEDSLRQQEDTTQLLAQVVELQANNKRLNRENEELASLVTVARECQEELTTELADLKEKYAEVLDLLHDTQDQLRRIQKKNYPSSRGSHLSGGLFSSTLSGHDSIASELHGLNLSSEEQEKADGAKSLSRVFDTVRLTSKLGSSMPALGYSGGSVYSTPTKQANISHLNTPLHVSGGGRHSPYFGSMTSSHMSMTSSGLPSLDSGADSDGSFHTDSEENYPASCNGVPGWPGTPDLDSCIRRLGPNVASPYLPYGCRTPDSIMSTGSGKSGLSGYSSGGEWRLPQKLQIIKPLEGSLTLHQWSRLATPHLGGLLEEREGVAIKGAMNADLNLELYSMSDFEEDDDDKDYPGKQFMPTTGIYTYTNSTVLHPDDVTSLTTSLRPTQSSVVQTSLASRTPGISCGSQPSSQPASRRGSTATFSTNVGLAKHLQERGVVHPTPEGIIPTATPANSPEGSRPGSPEPQETYKLPSFEEFTKSIHAGASFLKRTLYGREPSAPEGPRVNIVERVQALGVDRFVRYGGAPLSVGGVVTTRAQPPSPLLHLSNLIRNSAAAKNQDGVTCVTTSTVDTTSIAPGGIMSTPRITSPGERRPKLPLGAPMGIPGQPGSGQLDSRLTQLKPGQRADLGTVGHVSGRQRPSGLGSVPGRGDTKMGTVGWTSLGRKGGLL